MEQIIRSTLCTFTTHTIGRVRRRTSTQHRSIPLVVRSVPQKGPRTVEEREQFGRIPEQPRVALRVGPRTGLIDGLGVRLDGGVVSPPGPRRVTTSRS
jgi:hypothetical protein